MRQRDKATEARTGPLHTQHEPVCFLGRECESKRVEEALRQRKNLLLYGPAAIGKTALLQHVLHALPGNVRSRCLYLPSCKDLQDLLRKLLNMLHAAHNHVLRSQLRAEGVSSRNFGVWLKSIPSPRLKGALYRAVEKNDCRLVLDHIPSLTHAIAKILKELLWMRDTPVCLLVRDAPECNIGQISEFFYLDRSELLHLEPLPETVAAELLERCIECFGLTNFDLDDFRRQALELAGGVPGAIVKMCALASDTRYQRGSHIKTALLHIDYLMSGQLAQERAGLSRSAGGRQ